MPIYQRQTNPCVIDPDPGTAAGLSRIKQSVTVAIADLWGIRPYSTNRFIAIHPDIEPKGVRNKRHGTHQFVAGILRAILTRQLVLSASNFYHPAGSIARIVNRHGGRAWADCAVIFVQPAYPNRACRPRFSRNSCALPRKRSVTRFVMPSRPSSALSSDASHQTLFLRSSTTDPALLILRRRAEKDSDFLTCGLVPKISAHN